MNLILQRTTNSAQCRQGELSVIDLQLQTLERPWVPSPVSLGGTKGISCVPAGVYELEKHSTEAHPKTWALVNPELGVLHWPDSAQPAARTAVLIHVANEPSELRGCIGVGMTSTPCHIWNSRKAFEELLSVVPWPDSHTLEIRV